MVSAVFLDELARDDARPSSDRILTIDIDIFKYLCPYVIRNTKVDIIQNGRRNLAQYC